MQNRTDLEKKNQKTQKKVAESKKDEVNSKQTIKK